MSKGISTHVLDLESGTPGAGIAVTLGQGDSPIAQAITDTDGRVADWGEALQLGAGDYWLRFDTGSWRAAAGKSGFHPQIVIHFTVPDPTAHYHVPVLLSPFGYSTYRGS
ncbi:hydroxyisourate hydrolase [Haliea sp. E17]|uniref:hydroxyisourate hydrolase n=1 Tax=Haliea sp. E17 TaxID=3401576 RepID=UPI003AAF4C1E